MKVVGRLLGPPQSIDKTFLINKVRRRQRSGRDRAYLKYYSEKVLQKRYVNLDFDWYKASKLNV